MLNFILKNQYNSDYSTNCTTFSEDYEYLAVWLNYWGSNYSLKIYKKDVNVDNGYTELFQSINVWKSVIWLSFSSDWQYLAVGTSQWTSSEKPVIIYKKWLDWFYSYHTSIWKNFDHSWVTNFNYVKFDGVYILVSVTVGSYLYCNIYNINSWSFNLIINEFSWWPPKTFLYPPNKLIFKNWYLLLWGNLAGEWSSSSVACYKFNWTSISFLSNIYSYSAGYGQWCLTLKESKDWIYFYVWLYFSPYLHIYKRNWDVFTKLTNPVDLPYYRVSNINITPDWNHIKIIQTTWISFLYKKNSDDTFTKLSWTWIENIWVDWDFSNNFHSVSRLNTGSVNSSLIYKTYKVFWDSYRETIEYNIPNLKSFIISVTEIVDSNNKNTYQYSNNSWVDWYDCIPTIEYLVDNPTLIIKINQDTFDWTITPKLDQLKITFKTLG